MTLEEAKKILENEGFELEKTDVVCDSLGSFTRYESADVTEAMQIVSQACYSIGMQLDKFDERKERLKKEFEENTTDSNYKINPELVDASKAFNDALLDEQKKQIKNLEEFAASRNKIIAEQSEKISFLNKKITKKNKVISKKSRMIKDKDAVLADVAEELRLSKVREENLTSVCQKYLKEIEDLGKELALAKKPHSCNYGRSLEAVSIYVHSVTKAELEGLFLEYWENDGNKITAIYQLKNGKHSKLCLDFSGEEIVFSRSSVRVKDPCGDPKKSINTGDYISKEELMKIQEEDVRKITTPPFSPISEMRKGNGILDQMVVSADLGKGESYTSSVIIIPKETKPIEDEIMEGCKEMMRMNIKLMRDLLGE